MMSGLTRQALRRHPWAFLGPASTQNLAAALVVAALSARSSLDQAPLRPTARHALDDSGVPDIAAVFVVIAVYLTMVIVGVTMSATIARQARDLALARAVGATPGQLRRAIAAQAALVAVPATLLGAPVGLLGGRAWIDGMLRHGMVPAEVAFRIDGAALPIALGITVGTSLIGALTAALRPSRVRPAVALTATAVPRGRPGVVRTVLGVILTAGGVGLSIALAQVAGADTAQLTFFVLLALCLGAGLLGPALLRITAPVGRLFGNTGGLAADNIAVRARALSGALVPLVLAAAFAAVKVAGHTTGEHRTGSPQSPADLWIDYSGTAVYTAFAAVAALNTLITVTLARRRDLAVMRLAGGSRARMLAVVGGEALIVIVTGLVVAVGVAAATLSPPLHAAFGTWVPWLPPHHLAAGVLGVVALVVAGTVIPAAVAMHRPAIETAEAGA